MQARNPDPDQRYHSLSISLHWLTFLLLIAVYALIELRGIYPKGSDAREAMKAWHFMSGLIVFALVFLRLALRFAFKPPPVVPPLPAWQNLLAAGMHLALYAFLIVMSVLGWLTLSAQDKPVPFFGLELPALVTPNKDLGEQFEEIHETIGTIGYYLIGLHVLAALFHHYFMKDNTLRRMMPARGRGPTSAGS